MTLLNKQYGKSRLSVLNSSPELLHVISTFGTPSSDQFGEPQLTVLNNTGNIDSAIIKSRESIKNCGYLLEIKAVFEKSSDAELGAWEEPIPEETSSKNSHRTFPLMFIS
jgi:hypothetical protein